MGFVIILSVICFLNAEKEVVGVLYRVSELYSLSDYSVPGTGGGEGGREDDYMIAHEFLSYLHIEFILLS